MISELPDSSLIESDHEAAKESLLVATPPLTALTFNLRAGPLDSECTPESWPFGASPSKSLLVPSGNRELLPAGRYRLGREIARGGMGIVHRATDSLFNREVAIKFLGADLVSDPECVERFHREAQLTARLQHPGIPPVHDQGTDKNDRPFLAMKLIEGKTLQVLLQERPSLGDDLLRWLRVLEQIAETVGYAHSRGVIHRDLKPLNVMVGAFGEVQVMDWGLAKELRQPGNENSTLAPDPSRMLAETQVGEVNGTLAYMSPEQARGEADRVDARTDVFSLGAILCEILTGSPPYRAESMVELHRLVAAVELSNARSALYACGADEELIVLAERCLAADPADRPAEGESVAQEIARYRDKVEARRREAEAEKVRVETRLLEQHKRRRIQAVLVGTVVMLAMAIGGFAWWKGQVEQEAQLAEGLHQGEVRRQKEDNRKALAVVLDQAEDGLRASDDSRVEQFLILAGKRLAHGAAEELRPRFTACDHDLKMLRQLKDIQIEQWVLTEEKPLERQVQKKRWAAAFADYGITPGATPPEEAARKVNGSPIREVLLAGLEIWFVKSKRPEELRNLLAQIDPDEFRNQVRKSNLKETLADRRDSPAPEMPPWFAVAHGRDTSLPPDMQYRILMEVYERAPDNLLVLMALGMHTFTHHNEDGERQVGWYRAALAVDRRNPPAWNNLGLGLLRVGDNKAGEAALRQAIEQLPGHPGPHLNLGNMLLKQGKGAEAAAEYTVATRLKPRNPVGWQRLCLAQLQAKKIDDAEKALEESLRLDPTRAKTHSIMGILRSARNDQEGALAAHRKSIELDPESSESHLALAGSLGFFKKWDEALEECREAIRLNPSDPQAHVVLSQSLANKGDLVAATAAVKEAVRLNPKHLLGYQLLAIFSLKQKDWEGAVQAYDGLAKIKPSVNTYMKLGQVNVALERYPASIVAYRKALELNPNLARAYAALGEMLEQTRDYPGARAAYEKAAEINPTKFGPLAKKKLPDGGDSQ